MLGAYSLCTRSDLIMLYLLRCQYKNLKIYILMKSTASCINWKFPLATSKVGILTQILKKDTEVLINSDHDGVKIKSYMNKVQKVHK